MLILFCGADVSFFQSCFSLDLGFFLAIQRKSFSTILHFRRKCKFSRGLTSLMGMTECTLSILKTHLSGWLNFNELLKYLVCFRHKLGRAFDFFVVLAGHPKFNILITELRLEKRSECNQPIWKSETKQSTIRIEVRNKIKYKQQQQKHYFLPYVNLQDVPI